MANQKIFDAEVFFGQTFTNNTLPNKVKELTKPVSVESETLKHEIKIPNDELVGNIHVMFDEIKKIVRKYVYEDVTDMYQYVHFILNKEFEVFVKLKVRCHRTYNMACVIKPMKEEDGYCFFLYRGSENYAKQEKYLDILTNFKRNELLCYTSDFKYHEAKEIYLSINQWLDVLDKDIDSKQTAADLWRCFAHLYDNENCHLEFNSTTISNKVIAAETIRESLVFYPNLKLNVNFAEHSATTRLLDIAIRSKGIGFVYFLIHHLKFSFNSNSSYLKDRYKYELLNILGISHDDLFRH